MTIDQFTVYIIESPGPGDNLAGRNERVPLSEVLRALGLECVSYNVIDDYSLAETFAEIGKVFAGQTEKFYPIIHVSAHGTKEGIKLTNGEVY